MRAGSPPGAHVGPDPVILQLSNADLDRQIIGAVQALYSLCAFRPRRH
jgi:hypothetical protein